MSTAVNPSVSGASTIPLFGRAWKLSVKTADGNQQVLSQSAWEPEALRVTFNILESSIASPYWFADITVYNLDDATQQNLLYNATWVTLEGGYQAGPSKSSVIWDGPVLQVMFNRENVVDFMIRFNCIAGPWLLVEDFVNIAQGAFSSQYDAVSKMISASGGKASSQVSSTAQQMMQQKQYPRGKTLFGKSSKYIDQAAQDNFVQSWINGTQQYVSELVAQGSSNMTPDLTFGPPYPPGYNANTTTDTSTRSIIGVPSQNQFGAIFTVLLDPRLKVKVPPMLVKLDQTVITQIKQQIGQVVSPLDKSGLFIASQVRHYGDTRGNEWYTEVTGYTLNYAQGLLTPVFGALAAK